MITVYTLCYNEEFILPYFIKHYRNIFNNCEIVIYDNMSTDNTINIAKKNECKIIPFDTNNRLDTIRLAEIKNSCWKTSNTDWNIVCDVDEFLQIKKTDLNDHFTIAKTEGYNMHNLNSKFKSFNEITHGTREVNYDKLILFNKKYINDMNYDAGAHKANPVGNIIYSKKTFKLLHYHFLDLNMIIEKYANRQHRKSERNKRLNMSVHYDKTIDQIKEKYFNNRIIKVI